MIPARESLRIAAAAAGIMMALSACASTSPSESAQQRGTLIEELQTSKQTDLKDALEPDTSPVAQGDLMVAADKANDAIDKLTHGQYVSQTALHEALTVPPRTLSEEQRLMLIRQLQASCTLDNRGWWDYTRDPNPATDFLIQEQMCDQAIEKLRSGQDVSWWIIQQALYVPPNP
jgi:hypothetical protein